jgi:hypothetical protein
MDETRSDFSELGPLITLIGSRQADSYILRKETNDWASKPTEIVSYNVEQAKKDLKDLDYDVTKAQKANFHKNAQANDKTSGQDQLRELIKKVYVQLRERHVQTTQELKDLLEMDDLSSLTALLERMTIFVKERYYLKSLEKDELTSARNKLLELMLQSEGPFNK